MAAMVIASAPLHLARRVKATLRRAAHTSAPLRFTTRELGGRHAIAVYALRDGPPAHVAMRHNTPDVLGFDQIFCQAHHAEPPDAAQAIGELHRPPRVLDLGANVGHYAAWASRHWPGAQITTVEPDGGNLEVLRRSCAANGGSWAVVAAAAGASAGELRFHAGNFSVSRAALPGDHGADVVTVAQVDALALAAEHDVLKLDIEGGEWELLADPRLATLPIVALTLEYHAHLCPEADTHGCAQRLLRAGGFELRRMEDIEGAPPDEGVLWAWRT
jgi:FkbM family methyltransferase